VSAPAGEAVLLEGKKVGEKIRAGIKADAAKILAEDGVNLALASVTVGGDPASESYRRAQEKEARSLGIEFRPVLLPDSIPEADLKKRLRDLSRPDSGVHGIILQLPLPARLDVTRLYADLSPEKDVEGVHPSTLGLLVMRKARLIPCTALACMTLADETGIDWKGKEAVIVGQSAIVGRPVQLLLGERRATTVVCNTGTPEARLAAFVRQADLVIACAGKPGIVRGDWVREGAVVIDAGTTRVQGKLAGDVEFEEAKKKARYITPVPGGVGPLTVLMLLKNLVQAYRWQTGKN
jgi:methylenetetrahydrofolate dehydrogenase (NADP+)/methenyltetrahydrofolate cyclohydrolase